MEKPQFKHKCDMCVFLGRHSQREYGKPVNYDLYICGDFLLARLGNDPTDFYSWELNKFSWAYHPQILTEVLIRAIEEGHIKLTRVEGVQ